MMRNEALRRAGTRSRRAVARGILAGLGLMILSVAGPALSFESSHSSVTLLWSIAEEDCHPVELGLVDDHLWVGTGVLPGPASAGPIPAVYFKFMVDGSLLPLHYGKDLLREDGVVFAANPPSLVGTPEGYGYYTFTLRESDLTYAVEGAAGSFLAQVEYSDDPVPIPEFILAGTRVHVVDLDSGSDLGYFFLDTETGSLPITNLLSGHEYDLSFEAPGYQTENVRTVLSGDEPQAIMVTLTKLVPSDAESWGAVKVQYR